jgi:hypothetical protein
LRRNRLNAQLGASPVTTLGVVTTRQGKKEKKTGRKGRKEGNEQTDREGQTKRKRERKERKKHQADKGLGIKITHSESVPNSFIIIKEELARR